jgi:hypothetical protein
MTPCSWLQLGPEQLAWRQAEATRQPPNPLFTAAFFSVSARAARGGGRVNSRGPPVRPQGTWTATQRNLLFEASTRVPAALRTRVLARLTPRAAAQVTLSFPIVDSPLPEGVPDDAPAEDEEEEGDAEGAEAEQEQEPGPEDNALASDAPEEKVSNNNSAAAAAAAVTEVSGSQARLGEQRRRPP